MANLEIAGYTEVPPLPKIYDEELAEALVKAGFISSKDEIFEPVSIEQQKLIESQTAEIKSRWEANQALNNDTEMYDSE